MNADYNLIGRQIALHRQRTGITQEQLAEMCNLSVTHISRIENGHRRPSLDVLISIADILGTTIDGLLAGNQINDDLVYLDDINQLLGDCSPVERRHLVAILSAIKPILKNLA